MEGGWSLEESALGGTEGLSQPPHQPFCVEKEPELLVLESLPQCLTLLTGVITPESCMGSLLSVHFFLWSLSCSRTHMWSSLCLPPGHSVQGLGIHTCLLRDAKMCALVPGNAFVHGKCSSSIWGMEECPAVQSSHVTDEKAGVPERTFLQSLFRLHSVPWVASFPWGGRTWVSSGSASPFSKPRSLAIRRSPLSLGPSTLSRGS